MHLYDNKVNFFCSGIIAEGMGPGAGIALARKMRKQPGIAVAYNGDGAVNQGAFHEVMNMAALWKLPFVCVIEDNKYAASVTTQESTVVPAWKRAVDGPGARGDGGAWGTVIGRIEPAQATIGPGRWLRPGAAQAGAGSGPSRAVCAVAHLSRNSKLRPPTPGQLADLKHNRRRVARS